MTSLQITASLAGILFLILCILCISSVDTRNDRFPPFPKFDRRTSQPTTTPKSPTEAESKQRATYYIPRTSAKPKQSKRKRLQKKQLSYYNNYDQDHVDEQEFDFRSAAGYDFAPPSSREKFNYDFIPPENFKAHNPFIRTKSSKSRGASYANRDKDDLGSEEKNQLLNYYSQQIAKQQGKDPDDGFEFLRQKRFYPMHLNIGCVRGYSCCDDMQCKPFCSLCYGAYGAPAECTDANADGLCDEAMDSMDDDYVEEDDVKAVANEDDKDGKNDDDYDEADAVNADANKDDNGDDKDDDYDEGGDKKADPKDDDYDEDGEKKADADSDGDKARDANNGTSVGDGDEDDDNDRLELTYTIYEQYAAPAGGVQRRETRPPIIVQTVPHYSVSNFYTLNKDAKTHFEPHHHLHSRFRGRPVLEDVAVVQTQAGPGPVIPPSALHQILLNRPHVRHHHHHIQGLQGPLQVHQQHAVSHVAHPVHPPRLYYEDIHSADFGLSSPPEAAFGGALSAPPTIPPPTTHIVNGHTHHAHAHHHHQTGVTHHPTSINEQLSAIVPHLYKSNNQGLLPYVQPSTVLYENQNDPSKYLPPAPPPAPQPLVKYHLIRQSYPAKKDEVASFAGGLPPPAYIPGPPYVQQRQPSNLQEDKRPSRLEKKPLKKAKKGLLKGVITKLFG